MEWNKVYSGTYPELVDSTSSSVYIYYRRQIMEIKDEEGNTTYSYEELKVPKQFANMMDSMLRLEANVEYLNMMEGLYEE